MTERVRPYLFYDAAVSICSTCFIRVDAKILIQDGQAILQKRCPKHGFERVLLADDADYYRRAREVFLKAPEQPCRSNTPIHYGCPYDCGICPDHEQHSCLTLLELTDACNLRCPVCYAESGPERTAFRTLPQLEAMLDAIVANEERPDVVQISGGEPTLHPDLFAILDAAKARPIRHIMLNTNGVKLAEDPGLAKRLAAYQPGFEVYLQFDSFEKEALLKLRGADLRSIRARALERLNEADLSTTLVVTVQKGVNDGEIGRILEFAAAQPCVRGVTFQPVQEAGRLDGHDSTKDRLTLTEVRRAILDQFPVLRPEDLIPVPCHPDSLCMAYALKTPAGLLPLTGMIDPQVLIEGGRNTIVYEQDTELQKKLFSLFSTGHGPEGASRSLADLLCCFPDLRLPAQLGYKDVFRVLIMQFIDAHSFDLRSVKKTCVHIAHPDGRIIPFDTYNLFYRDGLEQTRLAPIRKQLEDAGLT